jgi:hypothetical protein
MGLGGNRGEAPIGLLEPQWAAWPHRLENDGLMLRNYVAATLRRVARAPRHPLMPPR